jgi:hypothetical protein
MAFNSEGKKAMTPWQFIETAPKIKDGRVLGYCQKSGKMAVVYWSKDWRGADCWRLLVPGDWAEDDLWQPTHWMPLENPPNREGDGQ